MGGGQVPGPAKVEESKMRPKICQRSKCTINASEDVMLEELKDEHLVAIGTCALPELEK